MSLDELKVYLDDMSKYLSADSVISETDSEIRAGKFLEALYRIAAATNALDRELFKMKTYKAGVWASVFLNDPNKTVDARTASAEANPTFTTVREQYSSIESDLDYLETVNEIFTNAHVFYRQKSKGASNGNFRS